jgi:2-iminobutanoate/2-iminopropanoate deaminase
MSDRSWTPIPLGDGLPAPAGAYSPVVRAGDLLFVAGQVPKDLRTGAIVGGDDVQVQTRQTLANLATALAAAGATLADVVSATVHLADEQHWPLFDAVWREHFTAPYPTRTVVGARLRGILVEVTAIAHRPS